MQIHLWHVLLALVVILGLTAYFQIREPMTDLPVSKGRFLPQVNNLGRAIDEKVAMDQKDQEAYAPADFNALFESLNL